MSLLSDLLFKKITSITKEQLAGVTCIKSMAFSSCNLLKSIELPDTVEKIDYSAFQNCISLESIKLGKNLSKILNGALLGCTALKEIDSKDINPYCLIDNIHISDTAWYSSQPEGTMLTMAKGLILVENKVSSTDFKIPDTVKNIASYGCSNHGSTLTSITVPDTVEMIQGSAFSSQSALTKITIGASVNRITGTIVPGNTVKDFIFRQPAGMVIDLPTPGDDTGMAYDKDAYSANVYTDNEYIRNYDWAKDNVTATFYSLSDAPT